MDDINTLRRILKATKTIAVVGLSANWWRPSFFAAKYLQERGYHVVPVNPHLLSAADLTLKREMRGDRLRVMTCTLSWLRADEAARIVRIARCLVSSH